MSSFKWIANSLKSLRITGTGAGGQNVQARLPQSLGTQTKLGIPGKPIKRPLSGYFKYVMTIRPEVVKKNPGISATDVVKMCSQQWKELADVEKEKYSQGFKAKMEEYKREMAAYKSSLTPAQKDALKQAKQDKATKRDKILMKKRLEELGKPKKAKSAYFQFVDDKGNLKGSGSLEECRKRVKLQAEKWKSMSDDEKAPYYENYQVEMEAYTRALAKWEEKMIRMGNDDLLRPKKSAKS